VSDPVIDEAVDDLDLEFGAWLVTCHPRLYDLPARHAEGFRRVGNWRVAGSYRAERMRPGDRLVLWLAGTPGDEPRPGVWGVGVVAGPVVATTYGPSPRFAWMDPTGAGATSRYVDADLRLLDEPIGQDELAGDDDFAGAEVLTSSDVGDPLVLSEQEWAAVARRLPAGWADPARWAELAGPDLPPPLDSRFRPVTADEVAAATHLDPDRVEAVLARQYEELSACYTAGDLVVTDVGYYCTDGDLARRAEALEAGIALDAVDRLVDALEDLAGDRLVLVPNDLPETPGFLDGTALSAEEATAVLERYWDLVEQDPARLDPFWLGTPP
jgi:hypothetical protein